MNAEALTVASTRCKRGVLVKASSSNSGVVYVGNSDVTANGASNSAEGTDGYELAAGESVSIENKYVKNIYVVASATNQNVFWICV